MAMAAVAMLAACGQLNLPTADASDYSGRESAATFAARCDGSGSWRR